MRTQLVLTLFLATFVAGTHARSETLCRGFLPPNDMRISESSLVVSGITHAQFDDVLDRINREYTREVSARGGRLTIDRRWSDATVNAFADRDGNKWILSMYGGMARHPRITYDGFMAIACHEMGHHLGGQPHFSNGPWATVEGGADYYATLKCLRRLFRQDDNEKWFTTTNGKVDPAAVTACTGQHGSRQDQLVCLRATQAGLALGAVAADLEQSANLPRLTTPDRRKVRTTFEDHPAAQCRVDTYFEGALCRVPYAQPLSAQDYRVGSCAEARTYTRGLRPRCWFAP